MTGVLCSINHSFVHLFQLMKDTSAQLNNLLCSDISDCLQEPEIPQVDMLAWTLDIQPLVESISGWAWTRRDGM